MSDGVWQDRAGDYWYGSALWDNRTAEVTALRAENERLKREIAELRQIIREECE